MRTPAVTHCWLCFGFDYSLPCRCKQVPLRTLQPETTKASVRSLVVCLQCTGHAFVTFQLEPDAVKCLHDYAQCALLHPPWAVHRTLGLWRCWIRETLPSMHRVALWAMHTLKYHRGPSALLPEWLPQVLDDVWAVHPRASNREAVPRHAPTLTQTQPPTHTHACTHLDTHPDSRHMHAHTVPTALRASSWF
jgi:hypothetical protein